MIANDIDAGGTILDLLHQFPLTIKELSGIQKAAQELSENAEYVYGKLFDLGDRVKVDDQTVTVVRRNKHTVTVAGGGEVRKITPSLITDLVEAGNPDEFDYWDYFGEA